MKYRQFAAPAALFAVAMGLPALGQGRQAQVDALTSAVRSAAAADNSLHTSTSIQGERVATPRQILDDTMMNIDMVDTPARLALEVWAQQTQVPLVVNWPALEAAGIDLDRPLTLKLRVVPAEQALSILVNQMNAEVFEDSRLLVEVTDWYVRVLTRDEALRRSTTKMYFIGDLLMDVPNFEGPEFDINNALSNTSSGGSSNGRGGGGGGLFPDNDERNETPQLSQTEKAEQIADIIRDTIEPDIWRENGGEYASIRYYRGMLIVKAPQFVHDQIGIPTSSEPTRRSATRRSADRENRRANGNDSGNNLPRPISSTSETPRRVR